MIYQSRLLPIVNSKAKPKNNLFNVPIVNSRRKPNTAVGSNR